MLISSKNFFASREITILGGGISGLLWSYFLAKKGFHVSLHEREKSLGGLIKTIKYNYHGEMYDLDCTAHFLLYSQEILLLCADLGVDILFHKNEKYFLSSTGVFTKNPLSFFDSLRFIRMHYLYKKDQTNYDNLYEYLLALNFTHTSILTIDAILYVTFGASSKEISVMCFCEYFFHKQRRNIFSFLKKKNTISIKGGTYALIEGLKDKLISMDNVDIHINSSISIESIPNRKILLCIPSKQAASFLENKYPHVSNMLRSLDEVSFITIHVLCHTNCFQHLGIGFTFMDSHSLIKGCLIKRESFGTLLTFFLGGSYFNNTGHHPDFSIKKIIGDFLFSNFNLCLDSYSFLGIYHYMNCIPLFSNRYNDMLCRIRSTFMVDDIGLFSSYTGSFGIRKILNNITKECSCIV